MALFYLIALGMVAIPFYYFYDRGQTERAKKERERDEDPADELLFDDYSGRYITIEEAREGILVSEEDINRVKTEEEIIDNYTGTEKEKEFAKNELRKMGIKEAADYSAVDDVLWDSKVISGANDAGYSTVYPLSQGSFLTFGQLYFYTQRQVHENMLLVIEVTEDLGQYLMSRAGTAQKWLSETAGDEVITSIRGYMVDRFRFGGNEEKLIELLDRLAPYLGDTTLEVCGRYIFVFTNGELNKRELNTLLQVFTLVSKSDIVTLR